ncbi:S1 RNA-binding domain-containing protein [Candidatus Micrarchaeota archaeon]|nr:S1 RNA-binding domain-containing protein [Candidatus Micrarchaeota archaeon]
MDENEYPEIGELVLVKVKKVFKYGAFVEFEEYEDIDGYIPINEVASKWIKNIHEFVSVGQRKVARVYRIDKAKGHIDLSLKKVTESDEKRKLEDTRKNTRAVKLFDIAINNCKITEDKSMDYLERLVQEHGDIHTAMAELFEKKEEAVKNIKLPKELVEELIKIASENMKKQNAVLNYVCEISVYEPKGIDIIKKLLGSRKTPKEFKYTINYMGAPKYKFKFIGPDYKKLDKYTSSFFDSLKNDISRYKSEFNIEQLKKNSD